jgi:hypothetical protein
MTVCIAAIASNSETDEEYIVTASDRMLATQEFSGDDIAIKSTFIAKEWGLMYAAEDVSYVTPISCNTRAMLYPKRLHVHADEVAGTLAMAYQRQIEQEATAKYLSRYRLTMREFLKNGAKLFPQAQYEDMHREIRNLRLGCEFLAYGFDDSPHIFRVIEPGKIVYEDESGFAAIGSGWYSAVSTLFFHGVNTSMELWEVVYHVLEAKFMAESAPGIGVETSCQILNQDGTFTSVFDSAIDEIRRVWTRSGMPRVPRNAEKIVSDVVQECEKTCREMDKSIEQDLKERGRKLCDKVERWEQEERSEVDAPENGTGEEHKDADET